MLAPEELSITIRSHEQYIPLRDSDEVLPPTLVKTSAVLGSLYVSFIARLDLSFYGITSNFKPLRPFAAFIRQNSSTDIHIYTTNQADFKQNPRR